MGLQSRLNREMLHLENTLRTPRKTVKVDLKVGGSQKRESEIHKTASELLFYGGGDGARTHDLLTASQVLFQLSYAPA